MSPRLYSAESAAFKSLAGANGPRSFAAAASRHSARTIRTRTTTMPPTSSTLSAAIASVTMRSLAAAAAETSAQVVPCASTMLAGSAPTQPAAKLSTRRKNMLSSCVRMMPTMATASITLKSRVS